MPGVWRDWQRNTLRLSLINTFPLFLLAAQISQVWNNTLVNLLKSLYSLGMDSHRREMQSVEQEVLWRLRRLTFRQLASLAEFLAVRQGKDSSPLLNEVIKKLELRWTELEGTRTVVTLMGKVGQVSPALMDRLEDKVGARALPSASVPFGGATSRR